MNRIPRHLTRLYEELYQPLPPELSSYACNESEDSAFDAGIFISPKMCKIEPSDSGDPSARYGFYFIINIFNTRYFCFRPLLRRSTSFLHSRHHKLIAVPSSGAKQLKVKDEKKDRTTAGKKDQGKTFPFFTDGLFI